MVALKPVAVTAVTPLRTLIGAETAPTTAVMATLLPVLLYATVTFVAVALAKPLPRFMANAPLACNARVPSALMSIPRVAALTPMNSELPAVRVALAPVAATMMSPPAVFWKPKFPLMVTKLTMVALKPVVEIAVTPLATLIVAVTAPTVTLVFTSAPVLLYFTVTFVAVALAKLLPRFIPKAPDASRAIVLFDLMIMPMVALLTPIWMIDPAVNWALAPVAASTMSPPLVFWNPKLPLIVTNWLIVATKPVALIAVVLFTTFTGAVTEPTLSMVLTSAPVLL